MKILQLTSDTKAKTENFLPKISKKTTMSFSSFLFNIILVALTTTVRHEKEIKKHLDWKEKVKLSLFVDN